MKIAQHHVSLVGVGIAGLAVVGMVLYYRHTQNAAQTAPADSGMGSFPYFQTAALPSSGAGSGAVSMSPAPAGSDLDIAGLLKTLTDSQAATSLASQDQANKAGFLSQIGASLTGLLSQQASEMTSDPLTHAPSVLSGFITPTAGGGYQIGTLAVPSAWSTTNLLTFAEYAKVFSPAPPVPANSTNSTPPPATAVQH